MFRWIAELLVVVVIITVLRSVIGVVMKILGGVFGAPASSPKTAQTPQRPDVPAGGELKKDPVCGTFISTATSLQKRVGGELYYFCSVDCRDKFKA
jgi:YHS domain-containing protein